MWHSSRRSILSACCLFCAGWSAGAQEPRTLQLERLRAGPLCLYYTSHAPQALHADGSPLIQGIYFYTAVRNDEGRMLEGLNFRRNEDGFLTFRKEKTADGARLIWTNKRTIRTRAGRPTGKLAGEATVTLTLTKDALAMRYQGKLEPHAGFGEIGFYLAESALTKGKTATFTARVEGGQTLTGTLPLPPHERDIARGIEDLVFTTPARTTRFTFAGQTFPHSFGVHFQDFRRNDKCKGCYRIVLSFNTTKGAEFDYTWRMGIRSPQATASAPKQAPAQPTATQEAIQNALRPTVQATVREVAPQRPAPKAQGQPPKAPLRVEVTDAGQFHLFDGEQPVVVDDHFKLFALGKATREETQDGDIRRIALRYDTPKGELVREVVVAPNDAWLTWTVKAKRKMRGAVGFHLPPSALRPPFIAYASVNQQIAEEQAELQPRGSTYCIVSGGKDDPREFQCGTSKRRDWQFQNIGSGTGYRLVTVPSLAAGEEWRAAFRYVRGGGEPYPAVSFDAAREERGILSSLLADAVTDGFTIVPARAARYTFTNRPLLIRLKYYGLDHADRIVTFRCRLLNMWGRRVREDTFTLATKGRRFAVKPFTVALDTNGAYRLEIAYQCGPVSRTRELVFTVLPEIPDTGYRPESVFGAAIGWGDYIGTLAKRIGLKWNRCHCAIGDTQAGYVVPERGTYTWERTDAACAFHTKYKLFACHSISEGWKAKWLSTMWKERPFDEYLRAYVDEYVKPLARRYKGRVRCWEVTNEPYYQFRNCPEKWVRLMKETYEALKAIDPGCMVVGTCGPPGSMGYDWYRRTFALGSLNYQDVVSSHLYHHGPWVGSGVAVGVRKWMRDIRGVMKEHGKVLPLWNSETTVSPPASLYRHPSHTRYVRYHPGQKPTDPIEQAQTYFKVLVVHKAEDVKYAFHIFHGGVEYKSHTGEYDETPLAFPAAQAALAKHLELAEYVQDFRLHPELQLCLFRHGKRLTVVSWGPRFLKRDHAVVTLPVPAARFAARDIFDNAIPVAGGDTETRLTVTWQGFYLMADSLSLDELKAAFGAAKVSVHFAEEDAVEAKGTFFGEPSGRAKRSHWVGFHPVDLASVANRSFRDEEPGDNKGGWTDEGHNDMRSLPTGDWLVHGVPFRILDPKDNHDKACVVLKGGPRGESPAPEKATVKVGQRLSKLYFLHGVTWAIRNQPAYRYVIHYTDGFREVVPVVDRKNVANWWWLGKATHARVAWEGPNPVREKVRLWLAEHEITHPKGAQATIDRIEIVSECRRAIPVVIAITGVYSN